MAVKITTGESPDSNKLKPALIKDLAQSVHGVLVESNVAYGGMRASTAMHKQAARDHSYTAIAAVDILDKDGSISLPVRGAVAGKPFVDSLNGNILYINVMNRLSVDCDRNGNPAGPDCATSASSRLLTMRRLTKPALTWRTPRWTEESLSSAWSPETDSEPSTADRRSVLTTRRISWRD
ncbi:MAG: hypothetical protein LBG43_03390 [Treponema sp.]|nr:hypothetical protein [Treponema sp.]